MIRIRQLEVHKQQNAICQVAELDVAAGERVTIVGANGSGKSTLLRVLGGLETEFTGECEVSSPMRDRCYVHQSPYMFRGSVLHNVMYGLVSRGVARKPAVDNAKEILNRLGLAKLTEQSTQHLSGGERRRVAIARAIVMQPRLLLLDEPFADVDQVGAEAIVAELERLEADSECTILSSSPSDEEKRHSGRVVSIG